MKYHRKPLTCEQVTSQILARSLRFASRLQFYFPARLRSVHDLEPSPLCPARKRSGSDPNLREIFGQGDEEHLANTARQHAVLYKYIARHAIRKTYNRLPSSLRLLTLKELEKITAAFLVPLEKNSAPSDAAEMLKILKSKRLQRKMKRIIGQLDRHSASVFLSALRRNIGLLDLELSKKVPLDSPETEHQGHVFINSLASLLTMCDILLGLVHEAPKTRPRRSDLSAFARMEPLA